MPRSKSFDKYMMSILAIVAIVAIVGIVVMINPADKNLAGMAFPSGIVIGPSNYICEPGTHKGDVNGDGMITINYEGVTGLTDEQIVRDIIDGTEPYPDNICCADLHPDMEGDGEIDIYDVGAIISAARRRALTPICE